MGKHTGNNPSLSYTCPCATAPRHLPMRNSQGTCTALLLLSNPMDFTESALGNSWLQGIQPDTGILLWHEILCELSAPEQVHLPSLLFLGISGCLSWLSLHHLSCSECCPSQQRSLTPWIPAQDTGTRNSLQRSARSFDVLKTSGFLQDFPCSNKRRMDGMKEGGAAGPNSRCSPPQTLPSQLSSPLGIC